MSKKVKIENDNISELLGGSIPDEFKDKEDFLDIIYWNLRWFNQYNKEKVENIYNVLAALNADIFVFQEIQEGSLNAMAEKLREKKKGSYEVVYGTTGGNQRVAIMYDIEWVRSKDNITELFGKNTVLTPSGKDVFPRLPLWGYFFCRSTVAQRGFDFQLVGLHMKSQMDKAGEGEDELQRTLAANKLAVWMEKDGCNIDRDLILCGDMNIGPKADCWKVFQKMEKENKVLFGKVNDDTQYSHLYYKNKNNWGSRLDLAIVTSDAADELNKGSKKAKPLKWLSLEKVLQNNASAHEINDIIAKIKNEVTDHLPVLLRFYVNNDN